MSARNSRRVPAGPPSSGSCPGTCTKRRIARGWFEGPGRLPPRAGPIHAARTGEPRVRGFRVRGRTPRHPPRDIYMHTCTRVVQNIVLIELQIRSHMCGAKSCLKPTSGHMHAHALHRAIRISTSHVRSINSNEFVAKRRYRCTNFGGPSARRSAYMPAPNDMPENVWLTRKEVMTVFTFSLILPQRRSLAPVTTVYRLPLPTVTHAREWRV